MRTLLQIEPRTPISSLPFAISSSGSYYLTTNLTGISGNNGITVSSGNVTIDLGGFTLSGVSGSGDGVNVSGTVTNVSVFNGTIQGWTGYGFNGSSVTISRLDHVFVLNNVGGGIVIGASGLVTGCQAASNLWTGITVGNGSKVQDCLAYNNNGVVNVNTGCCGILGSNQVTVSGCTTTLNAYWGISLGTNCAVSGCSSVSNALKSSGGGLLAGDGCLIKDTIVNYNRVGVVGRGIQVGNSCFIHDCMANGNAIGIMAGTDANIADCSAVANSSGAGEGIIVGSNSVVRGCAVSGNAYEGIVYSSSSFIYGNLAVNNSVSTGQYPNISGGGSFQSTVINNALGTNNFTAHNDSSVNAIGTLESASSLNSNKDPHANFSP